VGYDPSDARAGTVGVGYSPTPADSRESGGLTETRTLDFNDAGGLSPAISGFASHEHYDPSDRELNGEGEPNSGAQDGSPAFVYPDSTIAGMQPIELSPIDGGMVDPIRRGDNPSRRPFSRFLFITSKWRQDILGDFSRKDREIAGSANNGPKASQPVGRMDVMDEYRRLYDGSHA
jgi:hypothetical protein